MKITGLFVLVLLFAVNEGVAQTVVTDSTFSTWIEDDVDFVLFDVRGDAHIDSIVLPCFYTSDAPRWVDSMGCLKRLLIICHGGIYAHSVAQTIVANGYPEDSVFSGGFDDLTSSRFPASDTIPTALLKQSTEIPRPPTGPELRAVLLSRRPYRLIDVRDEWETEFGMIPGACVLPWYGEFEDEAVNLPTNELLILYCHSGSRASSAVDFLIENGFDSSNVISFGGFYRWYEYSLPNAYMAQEECGCPKRTSVAAGSRRAPDSFSPHAWEQGVKSDLTFDLRGRGMPGDTPSRASGLYLRNSQKWNADMLGVR